MTVLAPIIKGVETGTPADRVRYLRAVGAVGPPKVGNDRLEFTGRIRSAPDARGDVMDQWEAVTLFNDMCLLAPGTPVAPTIAWEEVDRNARVR